MNNEHLSTAAIIFGSVLLSLNTGLTIYENTIYVKQSFKQKYVANQYYILFEILFYKNIYFNIVQIELISIENRNSG